MFWPHPIGGKWGRSKINKATIRLGRSSLVDFMAGKIQPAFNYLNVRQIYNPGLIGSVGLKLLFQKILCNRQGMDGVRRCLELFHLLATNAVFLADAFDPVHPDTDAMLGQVAL